MNKQKQCTCEEPIPVSPCPPQIHCEHCAGIVAYDRKTALQKVIERVEKSQSASLRAAGYAFFLQDIGFDFEEISEHMAQRVQPERPIIVCLCGSTRFSQAFHDANLRETLAGSIVLSIGCDFKSDTDLLLAGELTEQDKTRLDELHLRKIDLADEILVLNVDGYVGSSTANEIAYARVHKKPIRWLEEFKTHALEEM